MGDSTQIKAVSIILQRFAELPYKLSRKTLTNCLVLFDQNSANFQMPAKTTVLKKKKHRSLK